MEATRQCHAVCVFRAWSHECFNPFFFATRYVPIVSLTLKQQNLMSRAVLQPLELHMLSACAAEKCDKADDEKKKKVSFLSVA